MALSQKHLGQMHVPWFNSKEWKYIKDLIFTDTSTVLEKKRALEILKMWKCRTPKLPSGVEGTLIILDALLQGNSDLSQDQIRNLNGNAIMRFLNLCGASGEKQGTFYKTAMQNNLPDWLVDLRHCVAHDQIIPSKFMLDMGLEFCLDWLKREYWEKQSISMLNVVVPASVDVKKNLKSAIVLYCQLNQTQFFNRNLKTVKDVIYVNAALEETARDLEDQINPSMDLKNALKLLLESINECITSQDELQLGSLIAETIVTDGSIFDTPIPECEDGKETIPRDFAVIWQDLINLLYLKKMLFSLIKELLKFTIIHDVQVTQNTRKSASLWLAEIFKCLLVAKKISKYNSVSSGDTLTVETAQNVSKNCIVNENTELKGCLNFDFQYCKDVIDDLCRYEVEALSEPNVFTLNFSKNLLQLCGYPPEYIQESELIIKKRVSLQSNSPKTKKLHTVEEFGINGDGNVLETCTTSTSDLILLNGDIQTEASQEQVPAKRWRLVTDTSVFEGCPLGLLAHQSRDFNPLLVQNP